jgi:hypothetical protein
MGAVIFVIFAPPAPDFFAPGDLNLMNLPRPPGLDSPPRLCFRPGP